MAARSGQNACRERRSVLADGIRGLYTAHCRFEDRRPRVVSSRDLYYLLNSRFTWTPTECGINPTHPSMKSSTSTINPACLSIGTC